MADVAVPALLEPAESATPPAASLFSQEQLESHAVALAASHTVSADPRRARPLLPHLDESAVRLEDAYQFLSTIARTDPQPVASEDWLRDNYHVVQETTITSCRIRFGKSAWICRATSTSSSPSSRRVSTRDTRASI